MIYHFHHYHLDWGTFWTASGVLVALFLGIVGIFQDWIRSWFRKPSLNVSIKLAPPDCHQIPLRNSQTNQIICTSYYFRFLVENIGNYQAQEVEAMVVGLYKNNNNVYEKVESFLPLNLVWSHSLRKEVTKPKIQPTLFKHLDFGYIVKSEFAYLNLFGLTTQSNIVFVLDVEVPPNTGSHIIFPGDYKIKIKFAGNNVKSIEKLYRLTIKDVWSDDEKAMLKDNIEIMSIKSQYERVF